MSFSKLKPGVLALFSLAAVSSNALANCPTLDDDATGNHVKAYVQDPNNIGSSWRLYVRPRNGACLKTPGGFQSPASTPGQSDGNQKTQTIEPGSKNCNDDYKSYMPVDVPSAQKIYDTYVNYASPTFIGFKVPNTKNGGYKGVIAVVPMTKADGNPDNQNAKVLGICFQ